MTNRTASLLMLFVAGLIVTGPLLAGALRVSERFGGAGPWLAPLLAVACVTLVCFAGRRFILPARLAGRASHALGTLALAIGGTMLVAFSVGWMLQSMLDRVPVVVPVIVLWFAALWWTLSMLHRTMPKSPAW